MGFAKNNCKTLLIYKNVAKNWNKIVEEKELSSETEKTGA